MRIRSTKPEFWNSKRIAAVSWDARFVLKALESYVDDNGVGKDDIELIVSDLFPRDHFREPSRTVARVSEAISELHRGGLVWRYGHEGTDLLYLSFWEQSQRIDKPQSGRFPRPDGTLDYKESVIREPVGNIREDSRSLAPGTGEQGNRGTDTSSSEIADAIPDPKNNRDDIDRVCDHLADRIQANGSKRPTITKRWRDAARLMIDRDGRTEEQIHRCIDWCQDDEFWRTNILSMPKLREKYDQLRLKAQTANQPAAPRPLLPGGDSFTPPPPPDDMPSDLFAAWNRAHNQAHRDGRPGPIDWHDLGEAS